MKSETDPTAWRLEIMLQTSAPVGGAKQGEGVAAAQLRTVEVSELLKQHRSSGAGRGGSAAASGGLWQAAQGAP